MNKYSDIINEFVDELNENFECSTMKEKDDHGIHCEVITEKSGPGTGEATGTYRVHMCYGYRNYDAGKVVDEEGLREFLVNNSRFL